MLHVIQNSFFNAVYQCFDLFLTILDVPFLGHEPESFVDLSNVDVITERGYFLVPKFHLVLQFIVVFLNMLPDVLVQN